MGPSEDRERELVPLKSDFDVVWRGYRRSQVQFFIQQTETELRLLTEDRDSALSQVEDLSQQLTEARAEIDSLRGQLDEVARTPISEEGLSARLRRMVRLAQDEANEVVSTARAAADHEWSRSEQAAAELRQRYERLVADADEWRQQWEQERREALDQTNIEIERMSQEAEERRRRLDREAEERRSQVEQDFEVAMAERREEALRAQAEREAQSRAEAEQRVREATDEANRRIRHANAQVEAMRRVRQDVGQRVRAAYEVLGDANPLLVASSDGVESEDADKVVAELVPHDWAPEPAETADVDVPQQREAEPVAAESDPDAEAPDAEAESAGEGDAAQSPAGGEVRTSPS